VAQLGSQHADLLKVGHHGSATSTTPEILAAAKPTFAVISVGDHTSFGLSHPTYSAASKPSESRSTARISTAPSPSTSTVTPTLFGTN